MSENNINSDIFMDQKMSRDSRKLIHLSQVSLVGRYRNPGLDIKRGFRISQ